MSHMTLTVIGLPCCLYIFVVRTFIALELYFLYTGGMKHSGQVLLTVESKPISSLWKRLSAPNIVPKSGCQRQPLVSFSCRSYCVRASNGSHFRFPFQYIARWLYLSASGPYLPTSTLCFKKTSPFLLLRLAGFGHDYRSVSLQCPALTYLLETEIFLIVEYQLKCCSVADDTAPHCHMVWSGAACCRQGYQWVAWTAAHLCESWWTTLWTFVMSRNLFFLIDFTV